MAQHRRQRVEGPEIRVLQGVVDDLSLRDHRLDELVEEFAEDGVVGRLRRRAQRLGPVHDGPNEELQEVGRRGRTDRRVGQIFDLSSKLRHRIEPLLEITRPAEFL